MSDSGSSDPNDPFSGLPFFGDLSKLFGGGAGFGAPTDGPVNWEAARQFAVGLANGGTSEPNVDPALRAKFAELSRIAELQVASATGLDLTVDGRVPVVVPLTRAEWAVRTLTDYRPLLEQLAGGLADDASADDPNDPAAALLSGVMKMIAPAMMAMSAGSMVGHLATRALGAHHLPIPRGAATDLPVVGPNVSDFVEEWSIDRDEVALWLCVHELLFHAVFNVQHVRDVLVQLLGEYASGFQQADGGALEQRLGSLEPTGDLGDMQAQVQRMFGDPEVLLGAMRTPAQEAMLPRLEALIAIIVGWVDHHLDAIGGQLIGGHGQIAEAMRRRRVTAGPQDRFVERMLGLDLRRELVERGRAFVDGVVERDGAERLADLWSKPEHLPTPNEVDAPGLWLARIDLPDLD